MDRQHINFRALRADEIECRVGTVTEKGCSLLLYKDARCDMNVLDETVGSENWQREHVDCKGSLFCRVGIRCTDGWVFKADCGTESNEEKAKGESSDSFKRACVNWGIGRELYTAPFIWVKREFLKDFSSFQTNGKTKYRTKDKFTVSRLEVINSCISCVEIYSRSKEDVVYFWKLPDLPKYIDVIKITALREEIQRVGWNETAMLNYLKCKYPKNSPATIEAITEEQFAPLAAMLRKKPDAAREKQ